MCNADFSQCIEVTHVHSRVSWELDRETLARSSIVCENAEMGRCMRRKMVSKSHMRVLNEVRDTIYYVLKCLVAPRIRGLLEIISLRTRNIKVTAFPPATYEFVRRVDEMKRQTPRQRYEYPLSIRSQFW